MHGNRQEIKTRSMLRETFLVLLLLIASSVTKAQNCNTTCGSGKSVQYPFGFSDGCGIRLNCSASSSEISIANFTVQNITSNSVFLNLLAKCHRRVESIAHLFGPNFAPTWNNSLLFQNCSHPQIGCLFPAEAVKKQFNSEESCRAHNESISCFSQQNNGSEIMSYDYLNRTQCKYLFGSIAFHSGTDSPLSFQFETIELAWWVSGPCDCAHNATCTTPKLGLEKPPGFRCQCNEGFYGDGFKNGSGCRSVPECIASRYVSGDSGRCGGTTTRVGILIAVAIAFFVMIVIVVIACRICIYHQKGRSSDNLSFQTLRMDKFLNDMEREKPIRFTSQQLRIATNNFTNFLGSGGFGAVYKGIIDFPNGTPVAVKVLTGPSDERIDEQFMAEVSTLGRIHHFNLVHLYGFCFERQLRALVYEYMPNGSLDKFLFNGNKTVGFEKLQDIALGTARGIAYLHEECQQRIVHYDIKPENILLDENFFPKVADFGLAKLCNRDNSYVTMTGGRGTPGYAAPEVWMRLPITHKCDVYSFGMLLFEILGRRRNLDLNLPESQDWFPRWGWNKFEAGEVGELMLICGINEKDKEAAERMVKVAMWCVQYCPAVRPLMSVVVKMLEGEVEIPIPSINPFQHMMTGTPTMVASSSSPFETDSSQTKTG